MNEKVIQLADALKIWDELAAVKKEIARLKGDPLPQRQDALDDQLRDLIPLANKAGCYDAADFIRDRVERHTNVVPK